MGWASSHQQTWTIEWKQTLNNRWSQQRRYVTGRLQWYPQDTAESFVKWSSAGLLHSPAKVLTFKKKKFYICSDVTHTHTHSLSLTHPLTHPLTHSLHFTPLHSTPLHFTSLTSLTLTSLTHTHHTHITHSHSHSLTIHEHTYIHTNSPTITAPTLLYFLFPSCFSMISLSLKKLVTCGVIRSFNSLCFVLTVVGQNPRFLSYVSQTHVFRKAPERLETQLLHVLSRFKHLKQVKNHVTVLKPPFWTIKSITHGWKTPGSLAPRAGCT